MWWKLKVKPMLNESVGFGILPCHLYAVSGVLRSCLEFLEVDQLGDGRLLPEFFQLS